TGYKVVNGTNTSLPAFCYSITVSNCGPLTLTNVTVLDDHFGDLTADIFGSAKGTLAAGATTNYQFKTSLEADQTNTVTASGNSIVDARAVTATDSATGHVAVASIACSKLVASPDDQDGNASDNHVLLLNSATAHSVTYRLTVTNTGSAN